MRINTFIVILLITFIICNNNNHIKGKENNGIRNTQDTCLPAFVDLDETYKTIKQPATDETGDEYFIKNLKYVKVTSANVYTFYTSTEKSQVKVGKTKIFNIQEELTFKLDASTTLSGNKNYLFPWTKTNRPSVIVTKPIGSFGQAYSADCDPALMKSDNQLKKADSPKLLSYEKIDQYTETIDEKRTAIGDAAIGKSVMLSRVDDTANRNYNIFLSTTQFCHFSCKIDNTECDLLVYETANYKSEVINLASIIGYTGTPKSYKAVKGGTATVVDTCAGAGTKGDECTKPQYTVISKGATNILTGYYKDEIKKYLVLATPPKMPADIQAKFPTFAYCLGEPGPTATPVQGVSNMFINSILLILIVILMI